MSRVLVEPHHLLSQTSRMICSRVKLMRDVWDSAWYGSTKTLDMHISVLRRKLGDDASHPSYITTIRGVGFRFDAPED